MILWLLACVAITDPVDSVSSDSAVRDSGTVDTADPQIPPGCGLASDLDSAMFLEGDLVEFSVHCTGEVATQDAEITAISMPGGATFEGLAFSWQTGAADGGRLDVVFSVKAGQVPSAETVTFWVADNPDAPDNVVVDPLTYTEEWGLPVFHVEPVGALSQSYTDATVTFLGQQYAASIKIRGATSAYYSKPGYMLEFNDERVELPAWGVSRDHLALLTLFDDNSYVRQKLVYDQWAAMADFWGARRLTPRTFYAVLYFDREYWGLFVALDRIDNEFLDQMGFDRDANLYKAINHDANFYLYDANGNPKSSMHAGYEKKEGLPEGDYSDLDALVEFTGTAGDAASLLAGAPGWFEVDEFMDWLLLVQYSASGDSAGKNCYLANVPGDTSFRYAPWDFNHSWGQDWRTYRTSSSSVSDFYWNNKVFWAFQEDDGATAALWERFAAMRAPGGPMNRDWIEAQVNGYYDLIEPSAQRDWARWGDAYYSYAGWAGYRNTMDDWTDYEGEKAYLMRWLAERSVVYDEAHP